MTSDIDGSGLPKIPNLELSQKFFTLLKFGVVENKQVLEGLLEDITRDSMAPFYEHICQELKLPSDDKLLGKMKQENTTQLAKLQETIQDATENLGEIEIRDAMVAKAHYLSKIGDFGQALSELRAAFDKTSTLGHKLDNVFLQIRIAFFQNNSQAALRSIEKAWSLIEEGGDWDRRNRLKVYHGLYYMSVRNFTSAVKNFLETVSTFTCYELIDYKTFVQYTVISAAICLSRTDIKAKIINGAEIQEAIHGSNLLRVFCSSFYNCQYKEFFVALAELEDVLKSDRYLHLHYTFYVREMRVRAYKQLLESYRCLTLRFMADAFGVTTGFIDKELSRFIATGQLHCQIDSVNGIVETTRPDTKNYQYQAIIKQGDTLLNRVQKLSRVINL